MTDERTCRVVFAPSGLEARVAAGTSVLDAARSVGADLTDDQAVDLRSLPVITRVYRDHELQTASVCMVDGSRAERLLTYLDVTGRPVLVIQKAAMVPDHRQRFQVTYRFESRTMLREPLMLVFACLCLCLAVMAYSRLEFSLKPLWNDGRPSARSGAEKETTEYQ